MAVEDSLRGNTCDNTDEWKHPPGTERSAVLCALPAYTGTVAKR